MHALISDLQRRVALWRVEHAEVAPTAHQVNLSRTRTVAPLVAGINGVFVLWLGFSLLSRQDSDLVTQWKLGLFLTHLLMGLSFGLMAWAAWYWRYARANWMGVSLPLLMASLSLVFVIGFVTFDQWVSANITPFLTGTMATSLVLYLRPGTSAVLFASAYGLFAYAIGHTQQDAALLLSNRLNGLAAVAMAWALSVLLWRKFTVITRQQALLEKINADLETKQRELQRLTRLDGLTA